VLTHWTFSPLAAAIIAVLFAYEAGLARLRSRWPVPRQGRDRRAWVFRGGVVLVLAASASPLAYWGMRYLWIHMVDHIVLMFFAPAALVAGGPVVPFAWALPTEPRRAALRWLCTSRTGATLRRSWGVVARPAVAFVALNGIMLAWHVPALFDAAMASTAVHDLAMEPTFLVGGLLFWRSILASHPYSPRARLRTQLLMVAGTNLVMVLLAMALAVFTRNAWYTMQPAAMPSMHMAGAVPMAISFPAQQTAAGVLWICGDFWALPAVVLIVHRLIKRDGSLLGALDRTVQAKVAV
jgi:cytochrome c oxidase assembly factor CtaG